MTAPILASYWFFRRTDMTALVESMGGTDAVDLFIDSGAFSAHTSGATIAVADYAAWLLEHRAVVNFAAGLDVIGDPQATTRNLRDLEDRVAGQVKIVPTFHVGSPWPVLDSLVSAYDFVALGGVVSLRLKDHDPLMPWLVTAHRVLRDAGAVAHGFGITRPPLPEMLPWYSVDSAYWQQAAITGGFTLWDDRARRMVRVVSGKPAGTEARRLIREYGGDPDQFTRRGFGLVKQSTDADQARAERRWAQVASAAAWYRKADHLRRKYRTTAPAGVRGDGPKVYLAAGSADDMRVMLEADRVAGTFTPAIRRSA